MAYADPPHRVPRPVHPGFLAGHRMTGESGVAVAAGVTGWQGAGHPPAPPRPFECLRVSGPAPGNGTYPRRFACGASERQSKERM